MTLLRRLDHPIAPALAALLYGWIVVTVLAAPFGGDLSAFVRAAPPWTDPAAVPAGLRVGGAGYDGQFYYRLALDPLTDRPTDRGIAFDRPAYRQQRILYPLLAWAVSGADERRVPLALAVVNVASMFAVGWVGGVLARGAGRHALWGSLFTAYPGFVVTVANDLTELVAAACVLAALSLLRSERTARAAAALALAALARETAALLTAAVALARARETPRQPSRWVPLAMPAMVVVLWQLALAARWRSIPIGQGGESFDPPLLGLFAAAWLDGERFGPLEAVVWAAMVAFVLASAALGVRAMRWPQPAHERAATYSYLALAAVLEANIWANGAVLRTLTELGMLTALLTLGAPARLRYGLLATELALCAALVVTRAPI